MGSRSRDILEIMKFSDFTLLNLILVILIFILVLGLASYSLNRHDKFKEIFEENSSAEDENVLKVIAPVPVEEASKDSIQDRLRSWFSVEENEDSEIVKYFLIGLGIVLILVGLFSLIYFFLRNHVMDVEMLIISKKGKWIYIERENSEPKEDIGILEKSRRWIVAVYEKIVEKLFGKKPAAEEPAEEKQKQKNDKDFRSKSEEKCDTVTGAKCKC